MMNKINFRYLFLLAWLAALLTKAQVSSENYVQTTERISDKQVLSTTEQNICNHTYHIGDKIERQQATFKHFDQKGKGAIWDLTDINLSDNASWLTFTSNPHDEHGLIINGLNTRYFCHQNDTGTYLDGYENNQSKISYKLTDLIAPPSFVLNSMATGYFNGYAIYSESVYSRIYGTYECQVDGLGTMLLPSGDTITGVTRVHIQKHTGQQYLKNIEHAKALRMLVDSVNIYTHDSIIQHLAVDSNLVETNIYRWYAQGESYPIYETLDSHVKGNNIGFKVAYYYSPQSLKDNEYEKSRNISQRERAKATSNGRPRISRHVFSNGTFIDYSVNVTSDGNVNVAMFCSSRAKIDCNIHTIDGMMVCQQSFKESSKKTYNICLPLSSHSHGIYILNISVNGQQFSEKFIYK